MERTRFLEIFGLFSTAVGSTDQVVETEFSEFKKRLKFELYNLLFPGI